MISFRSNRRQPLRYQPQPYVQLKNPEWSFNAVIYEVNIRQYTPEGTFNAFSKHLPRLKDLGVDILWLMPIHPIGQLNRKGTYGSYYAVKDYFGINPEFGTAYDLRKLIAEIHDLGMYVIIDWVANHTASDNSLVEEHPNWYQQHPEGNMHPTPWLDWDDVLDLDYAQPDLREYMTAAMKYWVKEFKIDGFRADVAGFVPIEFWVNLREELEEIKPVFMLAEWESRDLHRRAFDMTYAWSLWDAMLDATTRKRGLHSLIEYMAYDIKAFPKGAYRMTFTDNHDKNSWFGGAHENFGPALEAAIVLTCTVKGMPLVYSGQEAGLDRSLSFFEKDEIEWKEHHHATIFKKLFALKKKNKALWNGYWGGWMLRVHNDQPHTVFSFYREKNEDKIITVINFSDSASDVTLDVASLAGSWTELFSDEQVRFDDKYKLQLPAWGYKVFSLNHQ